MWAAKAQRGLLASSAPIARNHVAIGVVLDPHVRAFLQLRDDRVTHRILVKWGGRLLEESPHHPQQFPALHDVRRRLTQRA